MARDPVCGVNVKDEKNNNLRSDFKGQSFYFCSDKCRQEFDRNPSNFVQGDKNRNENRPANRDNQNRDNQNRPR